MMEKEKMLHHKMYNDNYDEELRWIGQSVSCFARNIIIFQWTILLRGKVL